MADATLYSCLDPDGPGMNPGWGDWGAVRFYNLLVPCLVTGYGTGPTRKEGQGWEIVHADLPKGFKLKSPDGIFYTFFVPPTIRTKNTPATQIYLSETLTDIAAYPPTGENVRSGPHSSGSTSSNRHWIACQGYSYGTLNWVLIARGSQVFFCRTGQGYDLNSGSGTNASDGNYHAGEAGLQLFFGNVIYKDPTTPKSGVQNHCVLGGFDYSDTHNFTSEIPYSNLNAHGRTRLRHPISGTVELGGLPGFRSHANMYTGYTGVKLGVDLVPTDLTLERRPFTEDGYGYVGYLPGGFISPYYSYRRMGAILARMDRSPVYSESLEPIIVDGEPFYMVSTSYGTDFFSLLEKYWV